MASPTTTDQITALYVVYFDRAPDKAGLDAWYAELTAGTKTLDDISNGFAGHERFATDFGAVMNDNQAFVEQLYTNMLGNAGDAAGVAYWKSQLDAGTSHAKLISNFVTAALGTDLAAMLAAGSLTQAEYDAALIRQNTLINKVSVAEQFVVSLGTATNPGTTNADLLPSDPAYMASVKIIAGVTSDAATVTAAKNFIATAATSLSTAISTINNATAAEIVSSTGNTTGSFSLTSGTDTATSNIFDAGQVYTPGGNDRINSIQDEDTLTGSGTNPTLNAVIGNNNDNGTAIITPKLTGIQTANLTFSTATAMTLDMQHATGLTNLNIDRVASGGATVRNMPGTAATLSVANSSQFANVMLSYRDADLTGAQTVGLTLDNVLIGDNAGGGLVVGADGNSLTEQIEALNVTVTSASTVQQLDTREDGVAATGQSISITANANLVLGRDTDDDGNVIEHNNALVDGSGVNSIVVTGAGNVTLGEVGSMAGFALTAGTMTGVLSANIAAAVADTTATFTSGSGADVIVSTVGGALNGDVVTNAGADTVTITGALARSGSVDSGDDNDVVAILGQMAGDVTGGSSITLGAGDDTLVLGTLNVDNATNASMAEESTVLAGDGNDTMTLTGTTAGDTAGDTDDDLGSSVDMGAGDDTVIFDMTNQTDVAGTLIGGVVAGGDGANTLTVTGNATVAAVANFDPTATPTTDAVTGFATLNLISEQSYNVTLANAINGVVAGTVTQNDAEGAGNNSQTADYTADLSEFTGVTAINMDNQAGLTSVQEGQRFEGDNAVYTLNNLLGTETVTLTTVEAMTEGDADRTDQILATATDASNKLVDATLNVDLLTATGANDTFTATLNGNGDVAINDNDSALGSPNEIENLALTIGGTSDRSIILAASNFAGTLTLAGSNTGTITVGVEVPAASETETGTVSAAGSVSASTVTSTLTGSVNLIIADNETHTITMDAAGGNDTVNMLNDTVSTADAINLGGGTANRLILNDALRVVGAATTAAEDDVFNGIDNVQELELRGASGNLSLCNDALATGVSTLIYANDTLGGGGVGIAPDGTEVVADLHIDTTFTRALTVSMVNESNLTIDNDGNVNLAISIDGRTNTLAEATDTTLAFTDAGTGTVALTITVDDAAQTISQATAANTNDLFITNADASAEIDSITLLDSNTALVTGGGAEQTGAITVTGSAQWAQAGDTLTVTASNIDDDDGSTLADDNQTAVFNFAAMNYKTNITATGLNDAITGGNVSDTVVAGVGNDTITGGTGADSLTGGDGADVFVYAGPTESNGASNSMDRITDFTSGTDKIRVSLNYAVNVAGDSINLSSFASVNNAGSGDNSLAGTLAVGTKVVGDSYYSSADTQFVVDVDGDGDITTAADLAISTGTVAATDLQFVVTASAGDDEIRTGLGADTVNAGAGNDVLVVVGAMSATDVVNYSAATATVVTADARVDQVLDFTELISINTDTEAVAGKTLDGQADNDTLHVYGTADLTGMTLANIETVVIHSDVTMTDVQYGAFSNVVFDGNTPHSLTIKDSVTGATETDAVVAAAGPTWLFTNTGASSTVTFGSTSNMTVAQASADAGGVIGSTVVTASDNTYASAKAKYGINQTGYTVTDTLAAVDAAVVADTIANVNLVLAGAAASSVTLTAVSGDISAKAYAANVDFYQLTSGASVTATLAQSAQINSAAGTNTVTLSANGTASGSAEVENYILATGANTFTVGSSTQNVNASTVGVNTINLSGSYGGTLTGNGADDVVALVTGTSIAGATIDANFVNLTLASGASVSMTRAQYAAFTGTITAAGSETVTITTTGAVTANAAIENYILSGAGNNITVLAATNVTGGAGADTVTVTGLTATGTYSSLAAADTILAATSASIAGVNGGAATGAGTLDISAGAVITATMTAAQHNGFSTAITAAGGNDTIVVTTATAAITGDGDIGTYQFTATSGNDFTAGAAGQNISLSATAGADAIRLGALAYTGTVTNLGDTDTTYLTTGADINAATGVNNGILNLVGAVTMTKAQYAAFDSLTATGGADQITITAAADVDIAANAAIETYVIGDDTAGNAVAVTGITGAQSVTATTANDAVTVSISGTYTGTFTGEGTTNDVASLATGANVAGATFTAVEDLTVASGGSVTMTAAQFAGFTGTVTGAGAETITFSTAAAATAIGAAAAAIENIVLSSAAADTVTVTTGVAGAYGGTINLSGGGADVVTITNAGIALADGVSTTVSNFNASGVDKIVSLGAMSSYQTITAGATNTTIAANGVVEISSTFGEVAPSNAAGGAVELLLDLAIADATSMGAGNDFTAVVYGGGNAYIYQVDLTTSDADLAAGDIVVELVATLSGVTADSLSSANFA